MRLVTFKRPGHAPEAGLLSEAGTEVIGLGTDMLSICAEGGTRQLFAAEPFGPPIDLGSVTLLAPVPRPPKLICVGLNYRDHAAEARMEIPKVPTIFSKFSNVVVGPGEPVILPKVSAKPDYEAELAFVIGRGGRHIPAAEGYDHVLGYTIVNDISARDFQNFTSQWLIGKTLDTFAPMGPWIVTKDQIPDPHTLDISLEIGGETLQHSNTREMVFQIPELIEFISKVVTLEPGDVVATGTPAGVGFGRRPPRWLMPGEEAIVRIEGIGELRNPMVAEL